MWPLIVIYYRRGREWRISVYLWANRTRTSNSVTA